MGAKLLAIETSAENEFIKSELATLGVNRKCDHEPMKELGTML